MKLKYILALADTIRAAAALGFPFTPQQIEHLADFCARYHRDFNREKLLKYIRDGPPKD